MRQARSLLYALIALTIIILWGTIGYISIEDYPPLDALYMSVITITTIGYGEIHPLSDRGRVFTMFLAFGGTGLLLLYIGLLTQFIVEGQVRNIFGRRRMERMVSKLSNHYIICGAGRIGGLIVDELRRRKQDFVIIERSHEKFDDFHKKGMLIIEGNAAEEATLKEAGIDRAKALIIALATDAETVFTILTARELNPGLFIIARANEVGTEKQITMAGANRVVSPYQTTSYRIINAIMRPDVLDMLDLTMYNNDLDLAMEGVRVKGNCQIVGKSLIELKFRADFGAIVVAIRKPNGKVLMGPGPNEVIEGGDVLIVAGRASNIERLAERVS